MRRVRAAVRIALAAAWLLVSGSPAVYAQEMEPLRVAGMFDLSGTGAIWGRAERNAFELACSDFERRYPPLRVETAVEDSMFSSKQTVAAFHKLTAVDGFRAIVGPTWETAVAMMPLCEGNKIVCFAPSFHGREFYARSWRYNFTAWFDDRDYASALARRANESAHHSIAVFAALTPYYDGLVDTFVAASSAKPVMIERVTLEERDFKALITKTPRDIDAVVMLLDNAGQIQAFMRQWTELRRDRPQIYTDDLIIHLDPPEDLRRHGFPITYSYPLFDQARLERFNQRYKAEYKAAPEAPSAVITYDETMLLLECLKRDRGADAVRDCIAATDSYQGLSGVLSFKGTQTVRGRTIGVRQFAP